MNDYGSMGRDALRALVRERKVSANGANGPTSWAVTASVDAMRAALEANDSGSVGAGATGIGAAIEAALATALARPSLDVDAVHAIIDKRLDARPAIDADAVQAIVRDAMREASVLRIEVATARGTVDVGVQHERFPDLVGLLAAGKPVLLVGPKGSGKSEAVKAAARALSLPFLADSFSADSGRHDVFGFVDASSRYVGTAFRTAFETGAVYCGDEMDNGPASLGAAFNLALSNGHANFPDASGIVRHADFRCTFTANTIHGATLTYNGREAVDGALLDRCAILPWAIDAAFERRLANGAFTSTRIALRETQGDNAPAPGGKPDEWIDSVQAVRAALDAAGMDRQSPSPRASINGAEMLARGWTPARAAEAFLYRGCDADARERIRKAGRL